MRWEKNFILSFQSSRDEQHRWKCISRKKQVGKTWAKFSILHLLKLLHKSHLSIFRCYNLLGHNKEAIEDAANAANINVDNYAAREALAVAFYADGQFELALAHFHRVFRSINISIYFNK